MFQMPVHSRIHIAVPNVSASTPPIELKEINEKELKVL